MARLRGPTGLSNAQLWLCVLLLLPLGHTRALWPEEEQRLRVGEKIFPACLTADQNLSRNVTREGDLLVLVVHQRSADSAREVATRLRRVDGIMSLHLRVEVIEANRVGSYESSKVAGVLLVTPDIEEGRLVTWGEQLDTLVFSPFAGDVEKGAVAGIHVSDRILPYVNLPRAKRAGVSFKPFFLKVAKLYE